MYRERYCQRRAMEMYGIGQGKEAVIKMLLEEQADGDKVASIAEKFYEDYLFLLKEERKKRMKKSEMNILVGSVIMGCGILFSLGSYLISGISFFLFYGLIITGLGMLIWGLIEKHNLKTENQI